MTKAMLLKLLQNGLRLYLTRHTFILRNALNRCNGKRRGGVFLDMGAPVKIVDFARFMIQLSGLSKSFAIL